MFFGLYNYCQIVLIVPLDSALFLFYSGCPDGLLIVAKNSLKLNQIYVNQINWITSMLF